MNIFKTIKISTIGIMYVLVLFTCNVYITCSFINLKKRYQEIIIFIV